VVRSGLRGPGRWLRLDELADLPVLGEPDVGLAAGQAFEVLQDALAEFPVLSWVKSTLDDSVLQIRETTVDALLAHHPGTAQRPNTAATKTRPKAAASRNSSAFHAWARIR
jgi:hypothetical protein